MDEKLTVMVTGAGGGGLGEGFLQTVRSAQTKYRVIATDMNPASVGIFEADKGYIVPGASAPDYLNKILEICKKENVKAIVPGSEPELMKISDNRKMFTEENILPLINDPEVINTCQDKWKTYNFLQKNGFHVPKSITVEDAENINWEHGFPVVLKPFVGSGGSRHAYIAQDEEDLKMFSKFMLKYGVTPMIQEYVGTMDDEYTVGVLTSMDQGDLIGSIAVKRNIHSGMSNRLKITSKTSQKPLGISTGISQGEIDIYPKVLENAEKIALKIGSKGPLNVQCRKQGDDVYTFEINPRFSGTSPIRAMVGYNEIDLTIRKSILHEELNPVDYKKGFVLRGLRNVYISYEDVAKITKNKGS